MTVKEIHHVLFYKLCHENLCLQCVDSVKKTWLITQCATMYLEITVSRIIQILLRFRNSEDAMLLVLKEIYAVYGISPKIPGAESQSPQKPRVGPPPKVPPPTTAPYGASPVYGNGNGNNSAGPQFGTNNIRMTQSPPQMFSVTNGPPSGPKSMAPGSNLPPPSGPYQMTVGSNLPPPSGPPPFSMGQAQRPAQPMGPPPMAGFVKKS